MSQLVDRFTLTASQLLLVLPQLGTCRCANPTGATGHEETFHCVRHT
jgi:hypothetical protein